jgi:hypothetical protein
MNIGELSERHTRIGRWQCGYASLLLYLLHVERFKKQRNQVGVLSSKCALIL